MMFRILLPALLLSLFLSFNCTHPESNDGKQVVIIFKHGKIAGDPLLFKQIIERFEAKYPEIKVKDETLPASTDEQHQFYVINLEGRSSDFDVFSMDVIWLPEFARAGWLRELSHLLTANERNDFFPGPIQAVTFIDKIYAIPWYIDSGLLYYRKDLLDKYGFNSPERWDELVNIASHISDREKDIYGFIWQGKQYEGLICNVLEYIWGNGGDVVKNGRSVINTPENVEALEFMRDLITKHKVTPPLVTTAIEEPTRHIFGSGRAVFMRNWPYAWNIFEKEGSPIRGKVGVSALPSFPDKDSASTLGGWQLGINRYSRHPDAAEKFITFLTSPEIQKELAMKIGYKPARKSLYNDPDLKRKQPFIANLYDILMKARPRPVSPYYMMLSQVMQPEFSAALSGIKTPEDALDSAHRQIEFILGVEVGAERGNGH